MGMLRAGVGIIAALLVVTLASAALLSHYVSITGTITILPAEPEPNTPNHLADCLHNGWREYTRLDGSSFENVGRCVSYVATRMCRDDGWQVLTRSDGSGFSGQSACVSYFVRMPPQDPSSWGPRVHAQDANASGVDYDSALGEHLDAESESDGASRGSSNVPDEHDDAVEGDEPSDGIDHDSDAGSGEDPGVFDEPSMDSEGSGGEDSDGMDAEDSDIAEDGDVDL